jgi:hypothetical protein
LARWLVTGVGLTVAALASFYAWYVHRPQPAPVRERLFQGILYVREVIRAPHPLVIHIMEVDLTAPGVSFLVTPGDPKAVRPLRARKTSTFLKEFGVQAAVNGDYFFPFHSRSPLDYYPHEGDPVELEGYAWSRGTPYCRPSRERDRFPILYLSRDNRVAFEHPAWPVENAISGICLLARHGADAVTWPEDGHREPCTAAAVSRDGKRFFLFLVEGRQPNYSEGVSFHEFARLILDRGAWDAIDLDGGGSETLVVQGSDGKPRILNSTIDHRIPGWERPVANHLGIVARRLSK